MHIQLNNVLLFVACKLSSILPGQLHSLICFGKHVQGKSAAICLFTNIKVSKLYPSKEHWFLYSSLDLVYKNKLGKQV